MSVPVATLFELHSSSAASAVPPPPFGSDNQQQQEEAMMESWSLDSLSASITGDDDGQENHHRPKQLELGSDGGDNNNSGSYNLSTELVTPSGSMRPTHQPQEDTMAPQPYDMLPRPSSFFQISSTEANRSTSNNDHPAVSETAAFTDSEECCDDLCGHHHSPNGNNDDQADATPCFMVTSRLFEQSRMQHQNQVLRRNLTKLRIRRSDEVMIHHVPEEFPPSEIASPVSSACVSPRLGGHCNAVPFQLKDEDDTRNSLPSSCVRHSEENEGRNRHGGEAPPPGDDKDIDGVSFVAVSGVRSLLTATQLSRSNSSRNLVSSTSSSPSPSLFASHAKKSGSSSPTHQQHQHLHPVEHTIIVQHPSAPH